MKEKKRGRERERARNGSGEKSCIEDEGGPISRTGWGCSSSFSAFDHARKVRRRDTFRGIRRVPRHGLFLRTIARSTIVNWNVIRAARPWISHRYRVLRCPPLIHSVLTSVVLPVSAFVELFRWPIARIFSITILLSFYESTSPRPPPLHRAASFGSLSSVLLGIPSRPRVTRK